MSTTPSAAVIPLVVSAVLTILPAGPAAAQAVGPPVAPEASNAPEAWEVPEARTTPDRSGPRFELGLVSGDLGRLLGDGSPVAGGSDTALGLYFDWYLSDRWVVSPSVSSILIGRHTLLGIRTRTDVRYLFPSDGPATPYVFGSGSYYHRQGDRFVDPVRQSALGAGAGLRLELPFGAALSLEARYDYWLDYGGEPGLGVRVGVPFGRR